MTQQQQHLWKAANGEALQSFAAVAVGSLEGLLDRFGVYGKTRKRILSASLCLEEVMAWYLYAQREEGLDYPERYMMKQAAAGRRPPEQFVQMAQLSWEQWRVFAAVCWLPGGHDSAQLDHVRSLPLFLTWVDSYGDVALDTLPFGVGAELEPLRIEVVLRKEEGSANWPEEKDAASEGEGSCTGEDRRLWEEALQELSQQMTRATFDRWLRDSQVLRRDGGRLVIGVCSEEAREWVANRLHWPIVRTVSAVGGRLCEIEVEVTRAN